MKIQLIKQNIKPMALNTETNSNPILKNTPADSFGRQDVAFKGSNVPAAFKEKVLASIAKKGEKGLDELCKDSNTTKATLTVLREFLRDNVLSYYEILNRKITFPNTRKAVKALVQRHNNMTNAVSFWNKLTEEGSKTAEHITELNKSPNQAKLVDSVRKIVDDTRINRVTSQSTLGNRSIEEHLRMLFENWENI